MEGAYSYPNSNLCKFLQWSQCGKMFALVALPSWYHHCNPTLALGLTVITPPLCTWKIMGTSITYKHRKKKGTHSANHMSYFVLHSIQNSWQKLGIKCAFEVSLTLCSKCGSIWSNSDSYRLIPYAYWVRPYEYRVSPHVSISFRTCLNGVHTSPNLVHTPRNSMMG